MALQIPCFYTFLWPLSVASAESRRYFGTACVVKPGLVEKNSLFIAFIFVCFCGLNAAWWRYLMSAAFDVMANELYAMCPLLLVYEVGDVMLHSCNGNIHHPVCVYLPPIHTSFLL